MKECKIMSFEELPVMLNVAQIAGVLGIGMTRAYELVHRNDFPTIEIGSRIIIPREKFLDWLDTQAAQKTQNI